MRHRISRFHALGLALALCSMLAIAACSGTYSNGGGVTAGGRVDLAGSPVPTADEILARMRSAPRRDATVAEHTTVTVAGYTFALDDTVKLRLNAGDASVTGATPGDGTSQVIVQHNDVTAQANGTSQTASDTSTAYAASSQAALTSFERLQTPRFVGTESIDGVAAYHLRGTLQPDAGVTSGDGSVTATEDLWVRQDTGDPVKVAIHASGTEAGEPFTLDITARFLS
jgi:hypothetical protein